MDVCQSAFGLLLAFGLLATAPELCAQTTYTWTGAVSGEWSTAANWNPSGIPGKTCNSTPCDIAVFGNSARTTIDFEPGESTYNLASLNFLSGAPAYTINFNSPVTAFELRNGIVNQSASAQKFVLKPSGSNFFLLGGSFANSLVTNASGLFVQYDASVGTATITNQSPGEINFDNIPVIDGSAATIINESGADIAVEVSDVSIGSLSGAGSVMLCADLALGALGRNDTISGPVYNERSSCTGSLTKIGTGTLTLSGASNYTGPTSIRAGTLQVDGSLSASSAVDVSSDGHSILSGAGKVGNVTMEPGASLRPGNANPDTALIMNSLSCDSNYGADVFLRLGNDSGGQPYGTQMLLLSPLTQASCARLKAIFSSASVPLAVGTRYLIAFALYDGTDYTPENLAYDFHAFPGYSQASGHFTVVSVPGITQIFFTLDSLGDKIFSNGFE